MLRYLNKTSILLIFLIFCNITIMGILPNIANYEFNYHSGATLDSYHTFFSVNAAILPLLLLTAPLLCFYANKNSCHYPIIFSLLVGFLTYLCFGIFFHVYYTFKTFLLLLGISIAFSNTFLLTGQLLQHVKKKTLVLAVVLSSYLWMRVIVVCSYNLITITITESVLKQILYLISIFYLLMLFTYAFCLYKSISYKSILFGQGQKPKRTTLWFSYWLYLTVFFKDKDRQSLLCLFLFCGLLNGLIGQYIMHFFIDYNSSYIKKFYIEVLGCAVLWFLLMVSGALIQIYKKLLTPIVIVSLSALSTNIIFVLCSQEPIYRDLLVLSYIWCTVLLFFYLLSKYLWQFNTYKFNLMMATSYIMYLFGVVMSQWIDIIFINIYISLYLAVLMVLLLIVVVCKNR